MLRAVRDDERPPGGTPTRQGWADPSDEKTIPNAPADAFDDKTGVSLPPFVEVELVYERAQVGMKHEPWRALEIWTRNRIYACDWEMTCVEVVDRKSGEPDPGHPLIGAHLAGGQKSEADSMEMTYPCPRPGTEAVFEYRSPRKGFVNTSTVTRVVLRLRVLTVPHERVEQSWETVTGSHRLPEHRGQ